MLTTLRTAAFLFASFAITLAATAADVNFNQYDDIAGENVEIILDDSHDLCVLSISGGQLNIVVLQFDEDDFATMPSVFEFSEQELIDLADNFEERSYDIADADYVHIDALGGDDYIWMASSYNIDTNVWAGAGDDTVHGGTGWNWIDGEDGNDNLSGGPNHDDIMGGQGNDRIWGHGGDDDLEGEWGNDELFGGDGEDELRGGDGDDILHGGNDADVLIGDFGFGYSDGNDDLDGGYDGAVDILNGGGGADIYRFRRYRLIQYTSSTPSKTSLYPSRTSRSYTIQQTLEMDQIMGFNSGEGDQKVSIRIW